MIKEWVRLTPDQWVRAVDDEGRGVAINLVGPYMNEPTPKYIVSGELYGEATKHDTLEEAQAAADARLGG